MVWRPLGRFRLIRRQALLGSHRRSTRRTNVPRKTIFKIGVATAAAAVAAILAITSAFAHGTPTTTSRSKVGTIVNAATGASLVSFQDPAPTALTDEQTADAIEAAELAAKIAAEQAALAAKLAAQQAEEAAEAAAAAAANTCVAADQTEDTAEKAGAQSEDSSETNATERPRAEPQ